MFHTLFPWVGLSGVELSWVELSGATAHRPSVSFFRLGNISLITSGLAKLRGWCSNQILTNRGSLVSGPPPFRSPHSSSSP